MMTNIDFLPAPNENLFLQTRTASLIMLLQPVEDVTRAVQIALAAYGENIFAPQDGDCWRFFEMKRERYAAHLYLNEQGEVLLDAYTLAGGGADADSPFIWRHPVTDSLFLFPAGHA